MYVSRIDIRNLRSYDKAEIHFSKGINIIIGANNSGKTTLLKSLLLLQYPDSTFSKTDIRKTAEMARVRVEFSDIYSRELKLFKVEQSRKVPERSCLDIFFGIYSGEKANDRLIINPEKCKVEIGENINAAPLSNEDKNDFIAFNGFSNSETKGNFIYPFLSKRKVQAYYARAKDAAFQVNEDLRNLPSRIQKLTNSTYPRHKDFLKYCIEILGFNIGHVYDDDDVAQDRIGFYANDREVIFSESMGEGVINILGLLTILLTENNKLFIIEEIENDIHPEALKKLLNIIIEKSNTNQFVISTHSNIVLKYLATAPEAKIFYTENSIIEDGNGAKLPTSTVVEIENTPLKRQELLEKLGYDMWDFDLFKSYLLFEESSAEGMVREFFIPQFVPELRNKLRTIAAGGATDLDARFTDFLRLFVYIHTAPVYEYKAWVVADGDKTGKENVEKLRKKFSTWPEEHFRNFSKNNFEEYYPDQFKRELLEINKEQDKHKKRAAKKKLTEKVLDWIREDEKRAKEAFETSAVEVIELLKEINKALNKKE